MESPPGVLGETGSRRAVESLCNLWWMAVTRSRNSPRILHLIKLDTIFGLPRLFVEYLTSSPAQRAEQHVYLTGGDLHPHLHETVLSHCRSVRSDKLGRKLAIPRAPRKARRARIFRKLAPDTVVYWNEADRYPDLLDSFGEQARLLFYDHERLWSAHGRDRVELAHFLGRMDGYLSVSRASAALYRERFGITEKVRIVWNGTWFTKLPKPEPRSLRPGAPLRIGFSGRLIGTKAPLLLPDVLVALRNRGVESRVLVAGQGEEEGALRKRAGDLGVSDRLVPLGLVTDPVAFYEQIDVLLSLTLRESFGLAMVEAMARGVPVVAPAIDSLPDIIPDGRAGRLVIPTAPSYRYFSLGGHTPVPDSGYDPHFDAVVTPKMVDPGAVAAAINEVVEGYSQMSAAAIEHVYANFAFDRFARELHEALVSPS